MARNTATAEDTRIVHLSDGSDLDVQRRVPTPRMSEENVSNVVSKSWRIGEDSKRTISHIIERIINDVPYCDFGVKCKGENYIVTAKRDCGDDPDGANVRWTHEAFDRIFVDVRNTEKRQLELDFANNAV